MSTSTQKELAQLIRDAADKWEAIGHEAETPPMLAAAYASDADDMREVAKFLEDGRPEAAADAVYRLDTIVQDELPQSVWDYFRHYDSYDDDVIF